MLDITVCEGTKCPFKKKCYRHTAKRDKIGQSYFMDIPYNKKTKQCEYLWKL